MAGLQLLGKIAFLLAGQQSLLAHRLEIGPDEIIKLDRCGLGLFLVFLGLRLRLRTPVALEGVGGAVPGPAGVFFVLIRGAGTVAREDLLQSAKGQNILLLRIEESLLQGIFLVIVNHFVSDHTFRRRSRVHYST